MVTLVWFPTSVALGIILLTTTKSWVFNQTMIEGWEADRHEAVAERGGRDWWDVTGPDGETYRFEKIEFPYDIGFFANMAQAMGTSNIIWWFFPFAGSPKIDKKGKACGWTWEENGFNRKDGMWPPIDPEKIRRAAHAWPAARRDYAAELQDLDLDAEDRKEAFRKRQQADFSRQRRLVAELEEEEHDSRSENSLDDIDDDYAFVGQSAAQTKWVNSDGERLEDYGVEEAEENLDEQVPLAELLHRRRIPHGKREY
jgi:palmitoyltransferase